MIRVAIEAVISLTVLLLARAIITSILRSFSSSAFGNRPQAQASNKANPEERTQTSGTLHRDPVCGTFVPETTPFRRDLSGSTVYYCSKACRESHSSSRTPSLAVLNLAFSTSQENLQFRRPRPGSSLKTYIRRDSEAV